MAKYRQIKRNGRWITVDENGREVKPGQGMLRDAYRSVRDNVIYSDKTDSKGNPLTIAQAKRQVYGPGGSPSGSGEGQARQTSNPETTKPKPKKEEPKTPAAEVKPAKPPVRASEQRTTTTSSSTRQSAPAKRDTRNDEYNRLRIKANKSGSAEDRKAAESEGMKAWRKANPKLAEALDRRNAAKNKETPKPETPASKRGSTSPTSGSKPVEGGSFNDRGMFDRKKRKKSGGGGSYA